MSDQEREEYKAAIEAYAKALDLLILVVRRSAYRKAAAIARDKGEDDVADEILEDVT